MKSFWHNVLFNAIYISTSIKKSNGVYCKIIKKQLEENSEKEVESESDNEQNVDNIESVPNDFMFVLKQITTRKYLIKITLIFSKDFEIDTIAFSTLVPI